ncbi:MAG: ABC transporter permease [Myxococcales bacterium]|jgi:peptide/nickel transport system permease protein
MRSYLAKRLATMVPTFFGITLVTFALIHLVPGDPLAASSEMVQAGQLSRESLEAFQRAMGLDQPLHIRYARWLGRVLTFDFGVSTYDHRRVADKLAEALPNTLLLSSLALFFAYLFAVPIGVFSAVRRGRLADKLLTAGLFVLYALPSFWVAIVLVLFLGGGRYLDLFPIQGLGSPGLEGAGLLTRLGDLAWHLVLPVFCLSYASLAWLSRYVRAGMLEALGQDYVRTARAKGLPERAVVARHALRNALIPLVTLLGLSVPHLIGGSVIVEQIFGVPGMGRLGFQAVLTRDYNTLMAVTTLTALLTMAGTLLSDLAYALVDPRIRCS